MFRQIALILVIVAIAQADVLGRRYQDWNNVNERGLYQRRYQELDDVRERGQMEKRGGCFLHSDCGPNESCIVFMCWGVE